MDACFHLFGIHWVLPLSTRDLLLGWWFKGVKKDAKVVWRMVPHAIFWCIWKKRNLRIFDGVEKSIIDLKSMLVMTLFLWFLSHSSSSYLSFVYFVDSLKL